MHIALSCFMYEWEGYQMIGCSDVSIPVADFFDKAALLC